MCVCVLIIMNENCVFVVCSRKRFSNIWLHEKIAIFKRTMLVCSTLRTDTRMEDTQCSTFRKCETILVTNDKSVQVELHSERLFSFYFLSSFAFVVVHKGVQSTESSVRFGIFIVACRCVCSMFDFSILFIWHYLYWLIFIVEYVYLLNTI